MNNKLKNYKFIIFILVAIVIVIISFLYKKNDRYDNQSDYDIQEFENFLTSEECDKLISLAEPKLFDSKIYTGGSDKVQQNNRISKQCWMRDKEHDIVNKISKKVADITGTLQKNQEFLQIVKYNAGGFFNSHYDACDGDKKFCERMNGKSGPRLATFIIYLNDDFEGGETTFPKLNKKVIPKRGKGVLFYNINPDSKKIIEQSLHSGNPVKNGEKWICNKWIRTKTYYV